jgi:uncharacterized repeat protein (TIGR01451 family)
MTTENCPLVLRRAKLRPRRKLAHAWIVFSLLVVFAAATATAQTTTVQFANNVTAPGGGIVLTGSGINPATGQHYRHFWGGDELLGLCRYDPDLDSPGPYTVNRNTCINFVGSVQFKPGAMALDATTNTIYAPNITATASQVSRMHFQPDSDGGHGIVDPINIEVLLSGGGGGGGKKGNSTGCATSLVAPAWAAIGPDGNLYVASLRSGTVVRVLSPLTNPLPCTNVQNDVINSPDGKKNEGLGWIGHDLYGGDGFSAWVLHNADQCYTAGNNFQVCTALNILAGQVPVPVAMVGDQQYPNLNGTNLYYTNGAVVDKVTITPQGVVVNTSYAVNFNLATGLALDTFNPAAEVLFVGDDPSAGNLPQSGHWWEVLPTPPTLQIPGAPVNVTATTGNAQATVSWQAAGDGQPISSYTVRNSSASNGTLVPDVTVGPDPGTTIVPTSAVVTGLTNGVTYQFEVAATNSAGTSAYSAPSNSVTPFAPTVPAAPTNVSAVAGDSSAQVAWTGSASDGGSPITGYTVTALVGGTPSLTANACANCTGVDVSGLSNGTTYTFTVHATNAVGNSAESAQSNAVTPSLTAIPPDISVSDAGPTSVTSGANATYTIKVNNTTTTTIPAVSLSDTWGASGATFVSVSTSQGACSSAAGSISCNLGSIAGSGSATVTLVLQLTAQTTNTASGSMKDAAGNPLTDPTPSDDTASATTSISAPSTTTDIQVTGSAQNGGPAVGTADTYTWQIKNNQKTTANAVVFTDNLPPSLQFASASTSAGTCSTPAPGTAGGTVTCNLSALNGGDTMTVTINVVVTQAGSVADTGVASFTGTDTNPANNSFTVTINPK